VVAVAAPFQSYIVENSSYRCVIDIEGERTISVTTDLGPTAARRIAEFEADRVSVTISLVYHADEQKKHYVFRLRPGGCMEDDGAHVEQPQQDRYDSNTKKTLNRGCPHSRKGSPSTCSLCIAAAERLEIIRKIKAGEL
jgi:hypothetical protein